MYTWQELLAKLKQEGKYLSLTQEENHALTQQLHRSYTYCMRNQCVYASMFTYDFLLDSSLNYCDISFLKHMQIDQRNQRLLRTYREVRYSHIYQYKGNFYVIVKVLL